MKQNPHTQKKTHHTKPNQMYGTLIYKARCRITLGIVLFEIDPIQRLI
jgi:hypothetical protein